MADNLIDLSPDDDSGAGHRHLGAVSILVMGFIRQDPNKAYQLALAEKVCALLQRNFDKGLAKNIMTRLEADGFVKSETKVNDAAPSRKYYSLTRRGHYWLDLFEKAFKQ